MKKLNIFIIAFLSYIITFSQSIPFFDDFEETISNDATFQNWTTENIEGWHYWHMVFYQGVNGSQCMRFENTDIAQNDWLVSNSINCNGVENLKVNFSYLYHDNKVPPKLYYTNQYNGNTSQSTWTELSYSFGENENQWYDSEDFIIGNPGNVIYFAFHYQAAANEGSYFLLDNFSLKDYIPIVPFELVGSSEHFEFYTNISGEENFYQEIENILEEKYLNYISLWQRPGFTPIFQANGKIKINYTSRNTLLLFNSELSEWDCGIVNASTGEVNLSPLISIAQQEYYGSFSNLAVNELSQLALSGFINEALEDYYLEGFGLYEMGYRPNRDQLLQKLSEIGTEEPTVETIFDISNLNLVGNKDLMASLFESKVLIRCYYYGYNYNRLYDWWQLLKHYYIKDNDRIKLIYSTEHFDIYGAEKETLYAEPMGLDLEEQFEMQQNRFNVQINHRINICIYDNEVGKEINGRDDYQGLACGADKINTSHLELGDYGLLHHEFMHVLVNIISNHNPGPGSFLNEGLAETTDAFMTEEVMPYHSYKIQDLYYHYQRKYNREPTFLEIIDNAEENKEDPFWVDAYALGAMFWAYMYDKYPTDFWLKVKECVASGRDWTVFGGKSTEEEGAGFIQFMKELAFVGPPLETTALPFYEDFETDFDGWSLLCYGVHDYWQNRESLGVDNSFGAYVAEPHWLEEKNVDSWIVSPPFDCSEAVIINVSFIYKQQGQGLKPEVYYAGNFTGSVNPVDWILVENVNWDAKEGEWGEINFTIENVPDKLNVAIRNISQEGNYATYSIDNFNVTISSAINDSDLDGVTNDMDICPNTPPGKSVDANGCLILNSNNFNIKVISETCPNKDNGQLVVSATENLNYSISLNGESKGSFTSTKTLEELSPGSYKVCIEVESITSPYCYIVKVNEGTTVSGKSSVISNKVSIVIEEGTAPYNVLVNGENVLKTSLSSFEVGVKHGDFVEIKTAILCEGTFSQTIDLFEGLIAYPNPTNGKLEIALPISLNEIKVELFTMYSQLISSDSYPIVNGKVQLNVGNLPSAVYVVKVYLENPVSIKIIKN